MAEQPHPSHVGKALVIGAGVSGLTTALKLARVRENGKHGYTVQVVAERPADQTVSVIAGALWEFPPAVCGQHGNQLPIMRSKRWSVESYKEFRKLITDRLVPRSAKIRADWGVDAIVNCTGMGAAELAGACMVPLLGALVREPVSRFPSRPKTAYAGRRPAPRGRAPAPRHLRRSADACLHHHPARRTGSVRRATRLPLTAKGTAARGLLGGSVSGVSSGASGDRGPAPFQPAPIAAHRAQPLTPPAGCRPVCGTRGLGGTDRARLRGRQGFRLRSGARAR